MDLMSTAQLLGGFGAFIGAIAVVVTLGYLTVQIRQNNQMLGRQAHYDRSGSIYEPFLVPGSPLALIHQKVNGADGTIEPVTNTFMQQYGLDFTESVTWLRYLQRTFFCWEADFLFLGRSHGLDQQIAGILRLFPNVQLFWKHDKTWMFTPQFVEYVDSLPSENLTVE